VSLDTCGNTALAPNLANLHGGMEKRIVADPFGIRMIAQILFRIEGCGWRVTLHTADGEIMADRIHEIENGVGCLIPGFDGAIFSQEWKEALWARFFMGAPPRLRRSVERYSIVKRA
jgi:hypothetical protein